MNKDNQKNIILNFIEQEMPEFEKKYEFRFARLDECDIIMKWIDKYWQKGHILSKNKELFLYEYKNKDRLNIFLAINRKTKEIEATQGVHYSTNDKLRDTGGSIFCAVKYSDPFLGLTIAKKRFTINDYRYVIGNGYKQKVALFMKESFGWNIGKLNHFYILNPTFDIKDFKIATIKELSKKKEIKESSKNIQIIKINNIDELKAYKCEDIFKILVPIKDYWYIDKRFFKHPIYKYDVYAIKDKNEIKSIFVIRKQEYNGNIALRIVDFIGYKSYFAYAINFLYSLFNKNIEYIDFYVYGFDELSQLGFELIAENSTNIIPDHFAPFEAKNGEIWMSCPKQMENVLVCKAWGDQDRPN